MAVIVETKAPHTLLKAIREKVALGSDIKTWTVDSDGDFTHSAEQWKNKAWLRPAVGTGVLTFKILTPKGQHLSRQVYAIYHGRFIEMLLSHFDTKFSDVRASALPSHGDIIKPPA